MIENVRFELDLRNIVDRVVGKREVWLENKDVISDELWNELIQDVMFEEVNRFIRRVVEKEIEKGIVNEKNIF